MVLYVPNPDAVGDMSACATSSVGPLLRLVPVGLVLLASSRPCSPSIPCHGVKVQFVLALVVAAGAGGGADRGALAGFVLGLMYDLAAAPRSG